MQAGSFRDQVSFQRVIVPLLRLVTMPRFSNSPLTLLSGRVLATLNAELPLDKLQTCVRKLAEMGCVQEPNFLMQVCSRPVSSPDPVPEVLFLFRRAKEHVTERRDVDAEVFWLSAPAQA